MLYWIESQNIWVIALIMFGGCYLLAAVVHFLVHRFATLKPTAFEELRRDIN